MSSLFSPTATVKLPPKVAARASKTAGIKSLKQASAALDSIHNTMIGLGRVGTAPVASTLPTVQPISAGQKTLIDVANRGSGTLDPTRTGTSPQTIQDVQAAQGGAGVAGYNALSAILGPDVAAHIPGTIHPQGAGKAFGLAHLGPVPIPTGVVSDLALDLPGGKFLKGGAKVAERLFKAGDYTARVPAASSRIGRLGEAAVDRARPVTSKIGIAKTETEKAGQAAGSAVKFQQSLLEIPTLMLQKATKHLDTDQKYALRIAAEEVSPETRIEHHLSQIAGGSSKENALYHGEHASQVAASSKYIAPRTLSPEERQARADLHQIPVEQIPHVVADISPDAPEKLKNAWHWFQAPGEQREDLLKSLGKLNDQQIAARIIAPARVLHGARYKKLEDIVDQALEGSVPREDLFKSVDEIVRDPTRAQAIKDSIDALSRSHAQRAGTPLEAEQFLSNLEKVHGPTTDIPENALQQGYAPATEHAQKVHSVVTALYRAEDAQPELGVVLDHIHADLLRDDNPAAYAKVQQVLGDPRITPEAKSALADADRSLRDLPQKPLYQSTHELSAYRIEQTIPGETQFDHHGQMVRSEGGDFDYNLKRGNETVGSLIGTHEGDHIYVDKVYVKPGENPLAFRKLIQPVVDEARASGTKLSAVFHNQKLADLADRWSAHEDRGGARGNLSGSKTFFQKGSVYHDPHTGQVVGGLDEPSTFGVKGAIEFTPENTSIIHLTTAADTSTFIHELAHHLRRFGMSPEEERQVAKWAGAPPVRGADKKITGYTWTRDAEERFARGVEAYVRTGRGPASIQKALRILSPAMREVYDHTDLPDIPQHVAQFLDKMFGYKPLKGGMLHGAEDVTLGVAYAPTFRGMPLSPLTKPHRAMAAYYRRLSGSFFSAGRKAAIGAGPDDRALHSTYEGSLLLSGFFTKDVVGPKVQSAIIAARMSGAHIARKILVQAGEQLPHSLDDIAVKIDPTKNVSPELKALWDKLASVDDTGHKLSEKDLEDVSFDLADQVRTSVFPFHGSATSRQESEDTARRAMEDQEPVDNIVWVPREFLDQSGLLHVPSAARSAQRGMSKQQRTFLHASGLSMDAANDFVKTTILYGNPAYIPAQTVGNLFMAAMQQGAFMPRNLMRSVLLHRNMSALDRVTIDHVMQHGIFSETPMFTDPGQFIKGTLGTLANRVSDLFPRRSAFLHEAYRDGLKTNAQISELLAHARAGRPDAVHRLQMISERANDAMVNFDKMTPLEREYLSRVVFFYPWLRGATHYSQKFIANHPVQAIALAMAVDHMLVSSQEILGNRPYSDQLDIPDSTKSVGLSIPGTHLGVGLDQLVGSHTWEQNGNPMITSLRQFLTFTTPADLIQSGVAFVSGKNEQAASGLVQNLAPVPYAAVVALSGHDPYTGQTVPTSLHTFLDQLSPQNQSPLWTRIQALNSPINPNSIHPRTKGDIWAQIGLGSVASTPYNVPVGQARAAQYGPLLGQRTLKLQQDSKAAGMPSVPPDVLEDLKWKTELDQQTKSKMDYYQKLQVAAKVFDERFGTNMATKLASVSTEGTAQHYLTELHSALYPTYSEWENYLARIQARQTQAQPVPAGG